MLGSNTFATGNVHLGGFNIQSLNVTGLTPGVSIVVPNVGINYIGSINADLYMGATGNGSTPYLADKLYLRVYYHNSSTVAWEGYTSELSSAWRPIASNITAGWQAYDLQFTLDANTGNNKQDVANTDTEILIYAVQHNGSVPLASPVSVYGNPNWFNLP